MEAGLMNQVNEMTLQFSLKEEALQKSLSSKEQQIQIMESRIVSAETRVRERDNVVAQLKEENTFQRHTIVDLKNQLYQLQHEIEDAEYDKVDGVDKWSAERAEMERELEALRSQVKSLSETKDDRNAMACWKQLDAAKVELNVTKKRLIETQSALTTLEKGAKNAEKEFLIKEKEFQAKLASLESCSSLNVETQLAEKDQVISSMKEEISRYAAKVESMSEEVADARARLENVDKYRRDEADDLRVLNDSLQSDVENLRSDLDELERELDEKNEHLLDKNQEISDLRAELEKISKELDSYKEQARVNKFKSSFEELERELNAKNETVLDNNVEIDKLRTELVTVAKELEEYKERALSFDQSQSQLDIISKVLESAQVENKALEAKLNETSEKFQEQINDYTKRIGVLEKNTAVLEKDIQDLVADRDELEKRLESAEEAKDQAIQHGRKEARSQDESRSEQRLREIVAAAAKERSDLEIEFETRLKKVEAAYEQKLALLSFTNSEKQELQFLRNEARQKSMEIERLSEQLRLSQRALEHQSSSTEMQSLRHQVRILEAKKASAERAKKQLREAQIALVALDDEKNISDKMHEDKIRGLENQIRDLERDFQNQILRKDAELTQLRDTSNMVSEFEAEISRLNAEIKEKDALLRTSKSRSASVNINGNVAEAIREELLMAKRNEEKHLAALSKAREELASQKAILREKVADRDTTISALVKSSVSQEQKMASMRAEINALTSRLKRDPPSPTEIEKVRKAREEEYIAEIENLRSALEDCKDVENRLLESLSTLERNITDLKAENKRLRISQSDSSFTRSVSSDHDDRLQERDSAIGNLVQQAMGLEQQVRKLMFENESLRKDIEGFRGGSTNGNVPSWAEVMRLQKESEIFAGQIIEQDEEMEVLRSDVEKRDARISILEREIATLKRKASSISRDALRNGELQAELDELQEANNTLRAELRDTRKQLREAISKANETQDLRAELDQAKFALDELKRKAESNVREDSNLRLQLEEARLEKEDVKKKLNEQIDSMRRLRNSTIESLEDKLKQKDDEIAELQRNDNGRMLEAEVKKLSKQLFEKAEMLEGAQKSIETLRMAMDDRSTIDELAKRNEEVESLTSEVQTLRQELEQLRVDKENIENTKEMLERAKSEKDELETTIVASYERKLSLLQYDKDVTIDILRKELAESKSLNSEHNSEALKHIDMLERQSQDANEEFEAKLQLKNAKIQALEQALGAQEQLVENMRAEMDHLQNSMERTSLSRRAEIEEMQQEMIDISSKAQRQEREITSLKMALEEVQLGRTSEVNKLKEQLSAVEKPPSSFEEAITKPKSRDARLDDVKERLENMKWRNTTLQEENVKLRKRLERIEAEKGLSSQERDNALAATEEVVTLRKRIQQLEQMSSADSHPPPQCLEPQVMSSKPPTGESTVGRSGRHKRSAPAAVVQPVFSTATRRQTPASPLRFLKRKQAKDSITEEAPHTTSDDTSSNASKLTF